jgi:hypothetical protein
LLDHPADRPGDVFRRAFGGREPAPAAEVETSADALPDLIRTMVDPEVWQEEGRSLTMHNQLLIVRADGGTQRRIRRLLRGLRAACESETEMGARVVEPTPDQLAALRSGDPKAFAAARSVGAADHMALDGRRVAPSTLQSRRYVTGYDAGGAAVEEIFSDGFQADMRSIPSLDRDGVAFELRALQMKLQEPRVVKTPHGTTEHPAGRLFQVGTMVSLTSGRERLVGSAAWGDRRIALLVRSTPRPVSWAARDLAPVILALPAVASTRAFTETKIRLEAARPTLREAARLLGRACDVDIVIGPGVASVDEARIEIPGGESTAATVLDGGLAKLGLEWRVRDGYIRVTAAEKDEDADPLRVHPIGDLTFALPDFSGPAMSGRPPYLTPDENAEAVTFSAKHVAEVIGSNVRPETWAPDGPGRIAVFRNALVVRHEPAVQEAVAAHLAALRSGTTLLVRTEARVVAMDEALLKSVRENVGALEKPLASGEATRVAAAEILGFNTSRAHALVAERFPPAGDGLAAADEGAAGGLVLDVRPIVSPDMNRVTVEVRFDMSRLAKLHVVESAKGSLIQPQMDEYKLRTTIVLDDAVEVVVGSLGSFPADATKPPKRAVLLLKATIVRKE